MGMPQPPLRAAGQRPLLGRQAELRRLAQLVAGAREGQSGALVLRGAPGIGKSVLLDHAVAEARGMLVLRASGVGSETELAFSGLSELFRPLAVRLDALPAPQAAALAGALGLGPAAAGDPLTVAVAALSLLALGAEDRGLVAVVDDAHWLDSASLEALSFAARRLGAEGVALVFAVRELEQSVLDDAGLPELVVPGLDEPSAKELLQSAAPGLRPDLVEIVLETAAGNPLALYEIPRALSQGTAAGENPEVEPLPTGALLEREYMRQLDAVPGLVRRVLVVAASAQPDETDGLIRAVPAVGASLEDLEWAEAYGILSLEGGIRFRHPLLRSAVYHGAPLPDRRAAHGALADALGTCGASHRVAWHRALAQAAPDEATAAALAQAGADALHRNAPSAAAKAFELAADLTPEPGERARRLLSACESLVLAGRAPRAVELLDRALADADDPGLRLEIQQLHGRTLVATGDGLGAHALLAGEAARLESVDPAQAAILYVEASYGALVSGRPLDAREDGERAFALAREVGGATLLAATLALAQGLIHTGEVARGTDALEACLRALEHADPVRAAQPLIGAASFLGVLGREEESRAICLHLVSTFRTLSAPGLLCLPLATLTHLEWRLGRWQESRSTGTEAVELGRSGGLEGFRAFALTGLARLDGSQGNVAEGRRLAAEALDFSVRIGSETGVAYALAALVLGALSEGDAAEAVAHGLQLARFYAERGYRSPGTFQWQADVIEAQVLTGNSEGAGQLLASFSEEARATRHPWALSAVARCRGLVADDDSFEHEFAEALQLHARYRHPFERARTEFMLGERRRRARRRTDARAPLRSALAVFEALGARPWAERARDELRACGSRPRRRAPDAADTLTPHELRVAQAVARGAKNREAAAELFLSPKTVDFHLRNIYRKLGVRSRTELANAMRSGR